MGKGRLFKKRNVERLVSSLGAFHNTKNFRGVNIMKKLFFLRKVLYVGVVSIALSGCIIGLSGCITAAEHAKQLQSDSTREMTVGIVQKEIRKGMTQADVAEALGSPNIVTKDKEGIETWIYDKIATEASYSTSESGILSIIFGLKVTGAASQTQKTLTVIIKFEEGIVCDFSYHTSKF